MASFVDPLMNVPDCTVKGRTSQKLKTGQHWECEIEAMEYERVQLPMPGSIVSMSSNVLCCRAHIYLKGC